MGGAADEALVAEIRALLNRTAERLAEAGVRDEDLAEYVPAKRVLGIERKARMQPLGRAWRLGVLLLERDGTLRAAGGTTRAVEPGHGGHMAVSVEQRREQRAAAFRGPFERGATVHFDAPVIPLDADALRDAPGPLFVHDGRALVRWSSMLGADAGIPLEAYLAERADLLISPPEGA